ncbi:uncharacterized protein LOC123537936 [Mercenaria mercenaria]|uniref:uncharacterized protein LOC123537936 n=1 Tax=Mercenaria mercenaria TaxID=6596 RepID=UPI00234F51B9|nr:uncharacterized protein LOC123537936 [Mercenaria mercenaria]
MHLFYNFFTELTSPVQKHYFCDFCKEYSGTVSMKECALCGKKKEKYFMYIPIAGQLQSILSGLSTIDLNYKRNRDKKAESNIEDVFDGKMYKKHFDGSHFTGTPQKDKSKELHISLQLNTDGVSIFRSSSYSVWPLYLIINELHPKQRFNCQNRIFAGLWFGGIKPVMNVFLLPLIQEMSELYHTGISIILHGKEILLRGVLLNVVCDAPARCLVQNFTQFNGFFGCAFCQEKGKSVKTSERGSMMSFPYDCNSESGHASVRKHSESVKQARDAEVAGKSQYGVKGVTVLTNLSYFDVIRNVTVDYMHCVLLGVQKMLLTLWTDSAKKTEKFYIGDFTAVLDARMKELTPPNLINRSPRCLADLKHWKATEYRSFLLFHSVCCLQGILSEEYYLHFILFVEGVYLLLQSSISKSDLSRAKLLFLKFCAQIDYLYGVRHETSNLHCLLHLVEKVEELGPLWSQSCFFFEDLNGDLRSLFHGTTKIELQIAEAVTIHQQLPLLIMAIPKSSEINPLYQRLTKHHKYKNREYINTSSLAVGTQVECQLLPDTRQRIQHLIGPVQNVYKFYRLLIGSTMFHSKMYLSATKRNSYTIEYVQDSMSYFGKILYFLKVDTESSCSKYLAVVKRFEKVECNVKLPCHFFQVRELMETDIIEVQNIVDMYYFAHLISSNRCFVGKIPVISESD